MLTYRMCWQCGPDQRIQKGPSRTDLANLDSLVKRLNKAWPGTHHWIETAETPDNMYPHLQKVDKFTFKDGIEV